MKKLLAFFGSLLLLVALVWTSVASRPAPIDKSEVFVADHLFGPTAPVASRMISLVNQGFQPEAIAVVEGTTVTWVNNTAVTHTLSFEAQRFAVYLPAVVHQNSGRQSHKPNLSGSSHQPIDSETQTVVLGPGEQVSYTYFAPGEYFYDLSNQPDFHGRIIVRDNVAETELIPIGSQTAPLGQRLSFRVLGVAPDDGTVSFDISPKPLPNNATFNTTTGQFSFRPSEAQTGTVELTFGATDGNTTDQETIIIEVPTADTSADTAVSGRLLDANDAELGLVTPLVNATISHLESGLTTTTDADGFFTLSGVSSGNGHLDFDGQTAIPTGTFGAYRSQEYLISHVNNVIDRPVYIMAIDPVGQTIVDPLQTTVVSNANISTTIVIPRRTVMDDDGNLYDGPISVSEVPDEFTPGSLPERLDPSRVLTIQPMGLTFDQPAPITFPNLDGLAPDSVVNIWSMDHETSQFFVAGTGRVTADGTMIETIAGGVQESSWHFPLPPESSGEDTDDGDGENQEESDCDNSHECASRVTSANGRLETGFSLPVYYSLGQDRTLDFVYNSNTAHPRPIFPFESTIRRRAAIPDTFSYSLDFGGVDQGSAIHIDTTGLNENVDETIRGAVAVNTPITDTGIYPYTLQLTSHYGEAAVSSTTERKVMVVNREHSPYGAGWGIADVARLHEQPNGDILFTDGSGNARLYELANTLLDDDFDTERDGFGVFNFVNFANWVVTDGSLDLVGSGFNDLLPGNGLYLDLDGTTGASVRLESRASFALTPGKYRFAFDLAGSQREPNTDSVVVSVGDLYKETISLAFDEPFETFTRFIDVDNPTVATIVFDHQGGDNEGLLLDNVLLQQVSQQSNIAPIPAIDLTIDGKANIFAAGRAIPSFFGGGGVVPPEVLFPVGSVDTVALFNVDGQVSCQVLGNLSPPDGGDCSSTVTDIDSFGGISGVIHNSATQFLQGVFVGNSAPVDPAPPRLDVTNDNNTVEFFPELNQTFFVGDGLTTSGDQQQFHVPTGATRLFLGFVDGNAFSGPPGFFNDNSGELTASLLITGTTSITETPYQSPNGDFSQLTKLGDGSYLQRLKDGSLHQYDMDGLLTATTDPNGNQTTYTYDVDRLITVTDPVGRITTLSYDGTHLDRITDPVGRTTTFDYDAAGNLTQVTFPDSSQRTFGYDDRHLMTSETDENDGETIREYDLFGRFVRGTLPDGTVRSATYAQSIGLIDRSSGLGTVDNPAPLVRPETVVGTFTDGENRISTQAISSLGRVGSVIDPAGFESKINRDANGNVTLVELPSGAAFSNTYDGVGNLLSTTDHTINGTTTYTYDPLINDLTSMTDPFNETTTFEYDDRGNLTGVTSPLNRTVLVEYEPTGLIYVVTDTLGMGSTYEYDAHGNIIRTILGTGGTARESSMTYTSAGRVDTVTDPIGRTFDYDYDSFGRLTTERLPGNRTISYSYDEAGNVVSITPPSKPAHTFEYDDLNLLTATNAPAVPDGGTNRTTYDHNFAQQLTEVVWPDGRSLEYLYDSAGRLTSAVIPRGRYTYTYDALNGQLATMTAPDGGTLAYQYSGELPSQITWDGEINGTIAFQYDQAARLQRIMIDGTAFDYSYDADNALTQAGNLNIQYAPATGLMSGSTIGNVSDTLSFNLFAELDAYSAAYNTAELFAATYMRNDVGQITGKVEMVNGSTFTTTYEYDAAGRLSQVTTNDVVEATYTYDANGNRLGDGTATGTYDDQDRLLSYGPNSYTYTANGERLTKVNGGQTTHYEYDVLGNLMAVTLPSGSEITYLVDAADRRIGRKVDGVLTNGWLYADDLSPVAELDNSGNVVSRFVYGTMANVPDFMVKDGTTYRIISDHLGSVRLVVDVNSGVVVQRMNYDAWGVVTEDTNPGFQPFGFGGGLYDAATGLVRFGARDYDAEIGRWTAKDPLQFDGSDTNLYSYAFNDPVNFLDTNGEFVNVIVGAVVNVATGYAIAVITGSCYSLGDAATDALTGAAGVAVFSKIRKLNRVSKLRRMSRNRGWTNKGMNHNIETWKGVNGSGQRLQMKFFRSKGNRSRYHRAQLNEGGGRFYDPFTKQYGDKFSRAAHIPLEATYSEAAVIGTGQGLTNATLRGSGDCGCDD